MHLKTYACCLVAGLAITSFPALSQSSYNLKAFKTPDIHFQRFSIGTDFSGGYRNTDAYNDVSGSAAINLQYFGYFNTDAYVGTHNAQLWGLADFTTNEANLPGGSTSDNQSHLQDYDLFTRTENRWYGTERSGSFFGLHAGVNQGLSLYESSAKNALTEREGKGNTAQTEAQVFAAYGRGRIEPVTYARLAYETYNWLDKKNRLAVFPSDEAIDKLGAVMTTVENTRFFDRRFKRIFQLEQIDSALQASGLITDADIVYFAQVADVWGYANNFERGSGQLWELGVVGDLSWHQSNSKQWYEDTLSSETTLTSDAHTALYAYLNYQNQKPLSVKWQRDYSAALYAGVGRYFDDVSTAVDMDRSLMPQGTLMAGYALGYYPNTRTSLRLGANGLVAYGDDIFTATNHKWGYALQGHFTAYYWVSPRFRVYGRGSIRYSDGFRGRGFNPLTPESFAGGTPRLYEQGWYAYATAGLSYAFF